MVEKKKVTEHPLPTEPVPPGGSTPTEKPIHELDLNTGESVRTDNVEPEPEPEPPSKKK